MKRRRALSKRVAEIVTLEAANVAGRVPPHDLDAEAAVLSACMLNRDAIDKVGDVLKPEHFYSYANRRIYEAILALSAVQAVRIDVDIVSIAGWLRDREILAEVGGVTYLAQLSDATPAVAHVATHAMMVREKWRLRQLIATCQHTAAEGYGDVGVIQEFLDDHERKVFELSATPERTTLVKVSSTLRQCFAQISAAAERGDRITGLSTGYEKFDAKTAGLHAGDLTIIAARPGCGKTSYALNIAVNVAAPRTERELATGTEIQFPGAGVAVFSLEMPREQLATRMVCSEGRVDLGRLRQGFLQPDDWRRLTEAASFLSALPLWIDDTPAITLQDVRAKVRRLQAEYNRPARPDAPEQKVGLVIIDYLQLMKGRDDVNSREQEISEISRGLKQLAKELKVPVIALSQLSRAVETRSSKDKRPQLSDLRECVTGDTLVVLHDGRRVPIRTLVGTTPEVMAISADRRVITAMSDKVWSVGVREIFRVTLAGGRSIRATGQHRLLGVNGWQRVDALFHGDRLAVVSQPSHVTEASIAHAESDLFWDRVVSVEPAGVEEVFDLTVPGPASWLADGVVSHNSGAIEQDADMVVFIYRDDLVNPETTNAKGLAELIIAKQRNGPTGKVMLRFSAPCTRFDNLLPGDYPNEDD